MAKLNRLRVILAAIIIVVIGINITTYASGEKSSDVNKGWETSEMVNEGVIQPSIYVIDESNIYYVSLNDWSIYSIDMGSGAREQVYEGKVCEEGIMLCSNFIYFKDRNDNKLYRIDKNSLKLEKVSDIDLGRQYQGFYSFDGDVIYFDTEDNPISIKRGSLQDNTREFYRQIDLSSKCYKGRVYTADENCIKSFSINGDEKTITADEGIYSIVYVDDKFIYYTGTDHRLYKVSVYGGSGSLVVNDDIVLTGPDFDYGNAEYMKGYIYYIAHEPLENSSLNRFSIADNKKEKVKENIIDFRLSQYGIYYMSSENDAKLHFLTFNNSADKMIDSQCISYLAGVQDNYLIYSVVSSDHNDIYGRLFVTDNTGNRICLK